MATATPISRLMRAARGSALPPLRRVAFLALGVLGLCLGLLAVAGADAARERAERRGGTAYEAMQARMGAMQAAARLTGADGGGPVARALLSGAAGPHGAAMILDADGSVAARGGDADLDPRGPGVVAADAMIPDGRTLRVVRPVSAPRWPAWTPHALAALSLALTVIALLGALSRYAAQAERDAREKRAAVARLLGPERAGCGVWRADAGGVTLPAALMAALGRERRDARFAEDELSRIVSHNDTARFLLLASPTDELDETRLRMLTPAGEERPVYLRVLSRGARAEGGTEGIAIPVSERGLDDGRSRQLIQRLRETLEAIPQAFLLWDAYGKLVAWNDEFRVIFDVASTEIREGMTAEELSRACGIDARYLMDYFAPPEGPSQRGEAAFPDDRALRITRRRTIGDGWVCIGTDVTDAKIETAAREAKEAELQMTVDILERSRAELTVAVQNYQREKARAEAANRSKSEFLANMSHELRTPLNAINGFSALMQAELYGPLGHDKYHEYVADILESGEHLLALIDDVLDLSKIEAGRLDLTFAQTDLERLLAEALRLIEPQAREADIRLHAVVDHVPTVWGDPRALKQVVVNLLSNAEKFTPQGGTVTLTAQADLDTVTILVADTGLGISPEQLSRLGQPFELIDDHFSARRRGTGLGLSLCKSLVELQSGVLAIASEQGRGTVAAVTLPRRPGATVRLPAMLAGRARVLTREPEAQAPEAGVVPFPQRAAS